MPLTPRQQAFVREYAIDRNGTQAAIRAGYSPKSAFVTASQLIRNPKVSAQLHQQEQRVAERAEKTAADIARFHWSVIDDDNAPLSERLKASSQEMRRYAEYKDGAQVNIDARTLIVGEQRL